MQFEMDRADVEVIRQGFAKCCKVGKKYEEYVFPYLHDSFAVSGLGQHRSLTNLQFICRTFSQREAQTMVGHSNILTSKLYVDISKVIMPFSLISNNRSDV
jgi:hypothetical protein